MLIFSMHNRFLFISSKNSLQHERNRMENIGITKVIKWGVDDFTSPAGLMIRRMINPVFRRLLRFGTRRKIVIEQYPKLERGQPYIFSATHSFNDDIISALSTIDRNAYILIEPQTKLNTILKYMPVGLMG